MERAALELDGLSYQYPDGTPALSGLSLRIERNERVALLGPNGAGKSTLLLHLNGLIVSSAPLRVCGLALEKKSLKAIRQKVGLVFQNPDDQLFCPTVYDDVAFGPRNMGLAEQEVAARVERSLSAVGLSGFEQRSAFHMSLGQKKRAAIATVLAMDAELLAFDEPTSSLDPRGRREIMELLEALGRTQLIVTHDFELARRLCQRAILLSGGRVVGEGSPEELLARTDLLLEHGLI